MRMIPAHGVDYSVPETWARTGFRLTQDYSLGAPLGWRFIREIPLNFSTVPMRACCARKTVDAIGLPKARQPYRGRYLRSLSMRTAAARWLPAVLASFSQKMAAAGRMFSRPAAPRQL